MFWHGRPDWVSPTLFGITLVAFIASIVVLPMLWWVKSVMLKAQLPDLKGFLLEWG